MFNKEKEYDMVYCSPNGRIKKALRDRSISYVPIKSMTILEVKRIIIKEKPDIIHAHDFTASVIASVVAFDIPVISHLHHNAPWLQKYCLKSILYGLSCLRYKKIITVSECVFDEYIFGKIFLKKLKVIANPVNIEAIIDRSTAYEYNDSFDICFCGRLSQPKNPLMFLDIIKSIIKQHPNLKAVMIGDGELRKVVENRLDELDLKKNVKLLGFVDNPYPIIKNCKVMCMPSAWEGFGLVAVEALALGVPVVCSGVGGLSKIVDDSCGDICTSVRQYCNVLIELVDNEDVRKNKSILAMERAKKLNNIRLYRRKIDSMYKQIKNGR